MLFGFFVPLLSDWGYSNFLIGATMTLVSFTSMIAQPLWGMYCDRKNAVKEIFVILMTVSAAAVLFLPLASRNMTVMFFLVLVLSCTTQAAYPLIDAWSISLSNEGRNIDYSLTRSFGSLSYALAAAGFGIVLDKYGPYTRIPVYLLICTLLIIAAMSVKRSAPEHLAQINCESLRTENSFRMLMKNHRYVIFIISNILLYLVYGALNSFLAVHIRNIGGTNFHFGLAFTVMGICQVAGMILFSVLRKKIYLPLHKTLLISMLMFSLKGLLTALSGDITTVLAIQVIDIIAYGMYFPSAVSYINEITDSRYLMTAQTVFSASTYGLGAMAGSFIGGTLSKFTSIPVMIMIMAVVSVSGAAIFGISLKGGLSDAYKER